MLLTKYVSKTCILPRMQSQNKADAIKELCRVLAERKRITNAGMALDQILAREVTESTGIGKGIAVPHARLPGMKTLVCAVGRIPEGLDFMAVDRRPVYLIFLICYPPAGQTIYLNFVATAAKLLSDPEHLRAMLAAKTAEDMFDLIHKKTETFAENHELYLQKLNTDPAIRRVPDAHADLILMARLQFCEEMLNTARTGKAQIRLRIETIRSLIEPRILNHYDKLAKHRLPALVPVEGDTCQGCYMRLPTQFVQHVRQDPEHVYTCTNCSRYIYVV
jgi:PTS system nitrogen regulatory IIA component